MDRTVTGVVKGSRVRMAEPARLGEPAATEGAGACGSGVTARIIEEAAGRAVVEIVCDCGNVIHLHCTCATDPAGGQTAR